LSEVSNIDVEIERMKAMHAEYLESDEVEREVLARYQPVFAPVNLDQLTAEEFKSFLLVKNNRHWRSIHRQSRSITKDMDALRDTLKFLMNEDVPVQERLDRVVHGGDRAIKGLGRAVITPILLMVYPDRYAVYNSQVEAALKRCGLHPDEGGLSFGQRYVQVNAVVHELAQKHDLSLFQMDHCFVGLLEDTGEPPQDLPPSDSEFVMERHLEDFLVDNWEQCTLAADYALYEKDGDIVAQQYPTDVGRIDLLARGKNLEGPRDWLVIELKKGKTGDQAVGQVLRYMGWVWHNLAKQAEEVRGLIIAREVDDGLRYATAELPRVDVKLYRVNFELLHAPKLGDSGETALV